LLGYALIPMAMRIGFPMRTRFDLSPPHIAALLGRYAFGIALVAVTVLFREKLFPLIGGDVPFFLLLSPIIVATWFGGIGPGLVSATVACLAGIYYFLPPYGTWQFTPESGVHAVVFGIECAIMTVLTSLARAGYMRLRDTARRMTAIYKISGALGSTRSFDEITEVIFDEAFRVLGVGGIALYIRTDENGPLHLQGMLGREERYVPLARLPALQEIGMDDEAAIAVAARSREIVAFESREAFRQRFPQRLKEAPGPQPEATHCAPMVVHHRTLGVLVMAWGRKRKIREEDRMWAQGVAQDCAFAIERTHLFEAERRARMQAEDATRAQETFFSSVSHEMRAPLMSILGWVHTLTKERRIDRDRYNRALQVIESSVRAQTRLVDDVIETSRVASQRARVDVKSADLGSLVRSWLKEAKEAAEAKEVGLETGPNAKAAVAVDVGRLRLAMHKVLGDAIDASPRGGTVCVASEEQAGRVRIHIIRRDGTGKDDSRRSPLQAWRKTTDASAKDDESHLGLNLAIANVVVRQHGGSLTVERTGPDQNPTITLDLPALDPNAGLLASSAPAASAATVPLAGSRVLLVDNDRNAREALGELLAADGAEVRAEASAKDALAALNEFEPTVIVSAVAMPEQDGNAFIRSVRALRSPVAEVPALALTAIAEPKGQSALDAGFQDRLVKPPHPRQLTDAILQMQATPRPGAAGNGRGSPSAGARA
jgi:K+-sensing histidine kinase KdpD/ActR/RegA family two-component response regulator